MATTLTSNLVIPQVMADLVEKKLVDNSVFISTAEVDNSLVGVPGDTLSIPAYSYIGDADIVAENSAITPVALTETKIDVKVVKAAKAVQITDEAKLSGYGNPVEKATEQLAKAIGSTQDEKLIDALETASLTTTVTALSSDAIVDALTLFGEDADGTKVLYVSPKDLAVLRKDADYINGSEIATGILVSGAVGMIWGCQIVPTNRLNGGDAERNFYIVKPGATKLINKRGVLIEVGRDELYQRDNIVGSKHFAAALQDESKAIKGNVALDVQTTTAVTSVAGTTAQNDTILKISEKAPLGTKWVYKLGSADVTPTFGTAVTSYTDWTSDTTEIAASTNTKASVVLVFAADNKPIKYANVTLVKKA